jgi:mono/diheme cytochrome c family protein
MRPLFLLIPLIGVAAGAPVLQAQRASSGASFENTVQPFLSQHCFTCHNAKLKTGGLNLQSFQTAASVTRERAVWERVLRKLQAGEMPPPGSPRPDPAAVSAVTQWITSQLDGSGPSARIDPGRVTARRLNRAEYNNTIRDLVGVDLRPADDFPQDDSGYGFDNIGDVLSLSPVLMEKYLAAAEKVARAAVFGPEPMKPTLERCPTSGRRPAPSTQALFEYDRTGLSLPNASHVIHRFPVGGEYFVRAVLGGDRPAGSEPLEIALWVDGRQVQARQLDAAGLASFAADRQDLSGNRVEFRTRFTAGDHWMAVSILHLYEGLPVSYGGPNPSKRPAPPPPDFGRFFQPPPNATPEQLARFQRRLEAFRSRRRERAPANNARAGTLEIGGPYAQAKGPSPESLQKIFTCGHLHGGHQPSCARKIIGDFARRAFRRPVTAQEVNEYLRLYSVARRQGGSFDEGICVALQGILVSPYFLFRIEKDPQAPPARRSVLGAYPSALPGPLRTTALRAAVPPLRGGPPSPKRGGSTRRGEGENAAKSLLPGTGDQRFASVPAPGTTSAASQPHPISQYELASRLSYFLWSSMPDDELMGCADRGALRKPEVLRAQVQRMLKDPKARALMENFGGQWLELRKLESVRPERRRFPEFDDYLRMSMRRETELFLEDLVRQDRSILDLIDGPYTFLNERLAEFYGIPGVKGPWFRKVDLTGTHRGGVLTQASVLTVSSYPTRTSPVLRGKWILTNLLNAPPPPPPPNVPSLDETKIGATVSLRQQLEAHRANPTCASCHARIDPLGFALENFDAIGQWRTQDGDVAVDSTGELPDGRKVQGADGLKEILKSDRDAFTRCVTEKLLTYALGRGLEAQDQPVVRRTQARVAADGYRFSRLALEIAGSPPFQMRRGDRGT